MQMSGCHCGCRWVGEWVAFSCKLSLHVISVCDLRAVMMFHLVTILMTSFQTAVWTSSYNYTAIVVLLIVFTHKPVVQCVLDGD